MLPIGEENAIPGRTLAKLFNTNLRTITKMIEQERRNGVPICASCTGKNKGYFKAETPADLQMYCRSMQSRANELLQTIDAMKNGTWNYEDNNRAV